MIKRDVDRLLFSFDENKFPIDLAKIVVYLGPFLSFLTFPKF